MIRLLSSRSWLVLPLLLLALTITAPQAQAADGPQTCDATTLSGKYLVTVNGTYYDSQYYVYLITSAGFYNMDGAGGFTGSETLVNDGTVSRRTVSGAYTLNADCTGSIVINGSDKLNLQADIVVNASKGVSLVITNGGTIISGKAEKQ